MIWLCLRYPRAAMLLLRCKVFGHRWKVMGRDNEHWLYAEGCSRCQTLRLTPWESWN